MTNLPKIPNIPAFDSTMETELREAFANMCTRKRERYPIVLLRGMPNTGKWSFVKSIATEMNLRLNQYSSLVSQKHDLSKELIDPTVAKTNVLSMFTQSPKPIIYGFRHLERILVYEKTTYRNILNYVKSTTPSTCKPIVFVLTEPYPESKYQDLLSYVGWTIECHGPSKAHIQDWLDTQYSMVPASIRTQYATYAMGDYRKLARILRDLQSSHPQLLKELAQCTFLEDNEKHTMKQRLSLYFEHIGKPMPEEIMQWTTMLQETELATMGQTIHETIFENFDTIEEYNLYLSMVLTSNQLQLLQHLYNRHAVEPYWIHSMIHIPYYLAHPRVKRTVKFTKLLTRSSIQSNYRKFIQNITQHKPMTVYMDEFETLENPVQSWMQDGLRQGDARRLFRSIQRIKKGGL